MPSTILAHTEVAAQIDLLSAWIEAQMAYRGQPGYRTEGRLYLSDKIAVIVLTNADDGNPLMYVAKAYQWIAPAILKAVTPAPTATTPNPVWQRYAGRWFVAFAILMLKRFVELIV